MPAEPQATPEQGGHMAEGAAPSAGLEEEAGGISLHSLSYEQLMQLKNSIEEVRGGPGVASASQADAAANAP